MDDKEILIKSLSLAIESTKKMVQKKVDDIGVHDLYAESVEMATHISYHAVKGVFPKKLFEHRSPNETQKESDYIKNNYKQLTLPVFVDYLSTITRPFGDGNWSIEYKDSPAEFKTADKTFQKYVESELPIYGSLENFVKFILPSIKSIDANGFLAVRPYDINYVESEEGKLVVDSSELYNPTIYYFDSKSVVDYKEGEYYLFLSKEKSIVSHGGKKVKEGNIFELYTEDAVYFIKQSGVKNDFIFDTELYFKHDLGKCQVKQLKGIPNLKGDKLLWQSPFLYAVDLLDLVTTNGNWLQAMINSTVFPVKVMFGSPCEFRDSDGNICQEGTIKINGVDKTCSKCNGVGLKSRLSPIGTLLLNPKTKFKDGEDKSSQDPLRYVSPEVHTLEFIDKKVYSDETKARAILHLRTKNSSTTTTGDKKVTATEVADDSKGMTAFVKPISDQIFDMYEWLCISIGEQRYSENFEPPALSYPKTFDFKNPEDYLQDVANATANNLPPSFIQMILMQYINSFYGDNIIATNIFKLVVASDRLFAISQDEINMQLAKGTAAKWESILHTSVMSFINDSIEKNPKFIESNIESQVKELQDLAKAKAKEIKDSTVVDIYKPAV